MSIAKVFFFTFSFSAKPKKLTALFPLFGVYPYRVAGKLTRSNPLRLKALDRQRPANDRKGSHLPGGPRPWEGKLQKISQKDGRELAKLWQRISDHILYLPKSSGFILSMMSPNSS